MYSFVECSGTNVKDLSLIEAFPDAGKNRSARADERKEKRIGEEHVFQGTIQYIIR